MVEKMKPEEYSEVSGKVYAVLCNADFGIQGRLRAYSLEEAKKTRDRNNETLDRLVEAGTVGAETMKDLENMRYRIYPGRATFDLENPIEEEKTE